MQWKTSLATLFSLSSLVHAGILDCLTGPCVTVPGVGKIQGTNKNTQFTNRPYKAFFGIPYGESTAGVNRFQPPKPRGPLNNGNDAFDASYLNYLLDWWDHVCPQVGVATTEAETDNPYLAQFFAEHPHLYNQTGKGLPGAVLGSEDCLHLAVFTPQLPTASVDPELPVMVYIHGGAFMLGGYIGAGAGKLLERDMVIVEMQYRVGPLGFMCLPDEEIAGNMGLLDQQLALQWVQNHISYFGGDPSRVTIMGESAGSASVTYHMLSEDSQPLFNQAIGESGSALSSWAFDSNPEGHAKDIASVVGCDTSSTSNMVHCLKNEKSIQDIVLGHKAYYTVEREYARLGFGGSVPCAQSHGSKKFISEHPNDILMNGITYPGTIPPKKAIFGANAHEGSFVLGMIYNSYLLPNNVMDDSFFLRHYFTETMLEAMGLKDESGVIYELINYRFFQDSNLGDWCDMIDGMINLVGTFFIKASTYEFMKYNDLLGGESYLYSFEYYGGASLWNFLFPGEQPPLPRGVTHGDELMYLFSTGVFQLTDQDWEIARMMTNMWANFVIYGNPTPAESPVSGVPTWPAWQDSHMSYLKIDATPEVMTNYLATWENTPPGPDKVPCA